MGAKSSYVPPSSDIPEARNPDNQNQVLLDRIINWDEGDIDHGPYGRRIGRGLVIHVLESPFLLVTRIGRGGDTIRPPCTFILSMFEARTVHVFHTLDEEDRWYEWSVKERVIEGRKE